MGNIKQGYLDSSVLKYIHLSATDLKRYRLSPGEILINRTNSLDFPLNRLSPLIEPHLVEGTDRR